MNRPRVGASAAAAAAFGTRGAQAVHDPASAGDSGDSTFTVIVIVLSFRGAIFILQQIMRLVAWIKKYGNKQTVRAAEREFLSYLNPAPAAASEPAEEAAAPLPRRTEAAEETAASAGGEEEPQ